MASQWLGAIPAPPGVVPNFVNPVDHIPQNVALHTVCLTLVTACVGMRLYTRTRITKTKLGVDDYFCFVAYLMTVVYSGLMIKCYTLGIGRHMWETPVQWVPKALKYFTFATWIYLLCTACVKLAFLFFYYRLFSTKTGMRYATIFGVVFVALLNIGLFLATVFSCTPIRRTWNPTVPGHCVNPVILPYLSGASSSATDLYVLALPVPVVWGLNMGLKRRLRVMAVFGVGLFACIASLVRLGMTPTLRSSPDATWTISKIGIWATLEINIGIICACLMLLPAFVGAMFPNAGKSLSRMSSAAVGLFSKRSGSSGSSSDKSKSAWEKNSWGSKNGAWAGYVDERNSDSQLRPHGSNIVRQQTFVVESVNSLRAGSDDLTATREATEPKVNW